MDPRDVQRMRNELEKSLQQDQKPLDAKSPNELTPRPLNGRSFETPNDPSVLSKPLGGELPNQPLTAVSSPEQGVRFGGLGVAHRTSTQHAELDKRLQQYY